MFSLIIIAQISAQRINKYSDIGSPCLHPLCIENQGDGCPLTRTVDLMFL